ncbi:MAG: hypothetical protein VYE73_14850, partial [Acidobacteriota bacterium]|nr:hypothetical protein [Acidobacteriota bacterium]
MMSKVFRSHIPSHLITPSDVFFNRRQFVTAAGVGLATIALPSVGCAATREEQILDVPLSRPEVFPAKRNEKYELPEGVSHIETPRLTAATHNNYYEFLPGRGGPAWQFASKFEVDPWKMEIGGL